MCSLKEKNIRLTREVLLKALGVLIVSGLAAGLLLAPVNSDAHLRGAGGLCGTDTLCKSIEGKKLDLIKYYSMESVLVILYDSSRIGELTILVPGSNYSREKGSISDAVNFLDGINEITGFKVLKGKKSVGIFRTETVDGLYIVKPVYEPFSEYLAPVYRFSERGGKIIMYINPIYEPSSD